MLKIEHPPYYNVGGIEVIDIIEAYDLDFHLGNVVKYVLRSGRKDPDAETDDLMKARFYLDRAISRRSKHG